VWCYANALYKYPRSELPYRRLVEENGQRGLADPEFELINPMSIFQQSY
jgi:hypothetical protein